MQESKNLSPKKFFILTLTFVFIIFFSPDTGNAIHSADNYISGEVLVRFKKGVPRKSSNAVHNKLHSTLKEKLHIPFAVDHIKLLDTVSVMDAVKEYMNNPDVIHAQPNYIKRIHAVESEYALLWAIHNTGQNVNNISGLLDADMDVLSFWNSGVANSTGSGSIIIAVIDTGVNLAHEDLAENIWRNSNENENSVDDDNNGYIDDISGWDFVNNDNKPDDDNGHGSHVAGIIAADGSNGKGVTGVMQDAGIMPLKILTANGSGTTADEIKAIDYAINKGAKIINISFGGYAFDVLEYEALSQARREGILVVASAGNDGLDNDIIPVYPASYGIGHTVNNIFYPGLDNIISVAASDQNDNLAWFSNYGAASVHIAAPGVNIFSAYAGGTNQYISLNGTSMAAPQVTGVAGLLWAVKGESTPYTTIKDALINNVDLNQCLSGKVVSKGRINAEQARTVAVVLSTPPNFTANRISITQINLSWESALGAEGYNIYRKHCSDPCSAFSLIYTVAANATAISDTGLTPVSCYEYIIRSVTTAEKSGDAAVAVQFALPGAGGSGGGCFIATAAYGSYLSDEVVALRGFRDKYLISNFELQIAKFKIIIPNVVGKAFVTFYYKYSPPIADYIKKHEAARITTKYILMPIVYSIKYPGIAFITGILLIAILIHKRRRHL